VREELGKVSLHSLIVEDYYTKYYIAQIHQVSIWESK